MLADFDTFVGLMAKIYFFLGGGGKGGLGGVIIIQKFGDPNLN